MQHIASTFQQNHNDNRPTDSWGNEGSRFEKGPVRLKDPSYPVHRPRNIALGQFRLRAPVEINAAIVRIQDDPAGMNG
jgi:hypothetical protein